MSRAHIEGFLAEVRCVNAGFTESRSSLLGLLRHLRATAANPAPLTFFQARQHCTDPLDHRLAKYGNAIMHLTTVWSTGAPYPGDEVAVGRLVFRGDSRGPGVVFARGFAPGQEGAIRYRTAGHDIAPETAVAVTSRPFVAANFPLPAAWGPQAFETANVTRCYVYAAYLAKGYNTHGQQVLDAIRGGRVAEAVVYAEEMATSLIPANHVLAAVQVWRNFIFQPGQPRRPDHWFSNGVFRFLTGSYEVNRDYTGPDRDRYLRLVDPILNDRRMHVFPI